MTITNISHKTAHREAGAHSGAQLGHIAGRMPAGDRGQVSMAMSNVETVVDKGTHILICAQP